MARDFLGEERSRHRREWLLQNAGEAERLTERGLGAPLEKQTQAVPGETRGLGNLLHTPPPEELGRLRPSERAEPATGSGTREPGAPLTYQDGKTSLGEPGLPGLLRSARFRSGGEERVPPSLTERLAGMDLCEGCASRRRDLFWSLLREAPRRGLRLRPVAWEVVPQGADPAGEGGPAPNRGEGGEGR